ncbi:MAG: sulfatase [Planctomycetaceae bacterium]|nr:sulfatase [Planctomycetaceae bacterium]
MTPHSTLSNRRELLKRIGMGMPLLGLASLLQPDTAKASPDKTPHFAPRAKHVVHLFMNGGPSQVDTFDPKPMLEKWHGKDIGNLNLRTERRTGAPMKSPFSFNQYGESGIPVSDLFRRTAKHVDDMAIIRSMYAEVPNHEPSLMLMNCGDIQLPRPSFGSWVTYGLGSENQNLPGFLAMCPGGYPIVSTRNWRSSFLPGTYQGTYLDTKNTELDKLLENIRSDSTGTERQTNQLELLTTLNKHHLEKHTADPKLEARIRSFEMAYRMQLEAAEAFDLARETQYTLDMYGDTVIGRQLLLTRRLIERGVRFIQAWSGAGQPWDNHSGLETAHRDLAQQWDQPIDAFISDLKQRGLFDETLILWGGEFGRTPVAEKPALNGRDHNHYGFSVWLAGGGIKGGVIHGSTDEFGFRAIESPTSVHDLHATMLHLLGLDHERLTFRFAGRDFRLTDVHGNLIQQVLQ